MVYTTYKNGDLGDGLLFYPDYCPTTLQDSIL